MMRPLSQNSNRSLDGIMLITICTAFFIMLHALGLHNLSRDTRNIHDHESFMHFADNFERRANQIISTPNGTLLEDDLPVLARRFYNGYDRFHQQIMLAVVAAVQRHPNLEDNITDTVLRAIDTVGLQRTNTDENLYQEIQNQRASSEDSSYVPSTDEQADYDAYVDTSGLLITERERQTVNRVYGPRTRVINTPSSDESDSDSESEYRHSDSDNYHYSDDESDESDRGRPPRRRRDRSCMFLCIQKSEFSFEIPFESKIIKIM